MPDSTDRKDERKPDATVPADLVRFVKEYEDRETDQRSRLGARRLTSIGAMVTIATASATFFAVVAATMGFRWIGPPADIEAIREEIHEIQRDRAIQKADLRRADSVARVKIEALVADVKITKYLVCVLVRRADNNLVPPECGR